ncbi:MAG: hypothetical protein ACOYL1_06700 [Chlamydiia bacterium]
MIDIHESPISLKFFIEFGGECFNPKYSGIISKKATDVAKTCLVAFCLFSIIKWSGAYMAAHSSFSYNNAVTLWLWTNAVARIVGVAIIITAGFNDLIFEKKKNLL